MDYDLYQQFSELRKFYPDELNNTSRLDFHSNGNIRNYCPNQSSGEKKQCKTELDKMNADCLLLFEKLFSNYAKSNIVEYIIIWLGYVLNLKNDKSINNLNEFYNKYIDKYNEYSKTVDDYSDNNNNSYKDLINQKKHLMNFGTKDMSKFYDAFKSLFNMYTECNTTDPYCTKYSKYANQFDYDNLKNKFKGCSLIPEIKTTQPSIASSEDDSEQIFEQNYEQTFEHSSEVTSSISSIGNKLIPVLSILVAITIFWAISYKYSLFGFRKQSQKQHLREKIKK
ncbi:Plasmodium variant antigen protein Cir/Yir/Bir, putative [Plasmodium berghei]|uniref:Plasmodium variant antigen protein Cir/Yir/Bir, putative n=1 Tax=Plasmodium berghei TaxID=5821 RepID=A0A0Z0A9G5_PLABE|nr:Plasmodium variant antigen protein Cir/Yir/Bir, putative [Plasmodium berghei]SCM25898.1 Plasmodium variant antigen protein Cir/Yir/Bir, putative [Plasmodium berghei]SCN28170.1 Plasmodium variant antigen protein Cir/Yir/Bir, putative [Plasmodium berghei]SCO62373.1 Plasmodium variant antigen protein Cir/Yir/Bir, putative [Plasmodium berghei]SCO63931.1 Plasmodium variant antigen protein Cir/Yir/Bir, putative [Plasmodium berghei]